MNALKRCHKNMCVKGHQLGKHPPSQVGRSRTTDFSIIYVFWIVEISCNTLSTQQQVSGDGTQLEGPIPIVSESRWSPLESANTSFSSLSATTQSTLPLSLTNPRGRRKKETHRFFSQTLPSTTFFVGKSHPQLLI